MKTYGKKSRFNQGTERCGVLPGADAIAAWSRALPLFGAVACFAAMPVLADSLPADSVEIGMGTGDCGMASIDGNPSEWLAQEGSWDFYSAMYKDGDPTIAGGKVLADLYLRYQDGTAYILVLAREGNTVVEDASAAWLRNYKLAHPLVPWDQGPAPVWVKNDQNQTIGYEASFPLPADGIWPAEVRVAAVSGGVTYSASTGAMTWQNIALERPECKVGVGNLVWREDPNNPDQASGVFEPQYDVPLKGMTIWLDRIDTSIPEGTGDERCDPERLGTDVIESAAVVTDAQTGLYLFDHVLPGSFRVRVPASEFQQGQLANGNAVQTWSSDNRDDNVNQNAIPASSNAAAVNYGVCTAVFSVEVGLAPPQAVQTGQPGPATTLPDSSVDRTRDLALTTQPEPGDNMSIGSVIFIDANHNGKQDAGEPGIGGVTVELTGNGLVTAKTTVTADDGTYLFRDLFPTDQGPYVVTIPASELAPGGHVSDALKTYYGNLGISQSAVPARAISTKVNVGSDKVDGENKGSQAFGIDVTATAQPNPATVTETLVAYGEPENGTGNAAGIESQIGMSRDNDLASDPKFEPLYTETAMDQNGDMTIDLGFVHACQEICDVDGDGKVTEADTRQIVQWGRSNKRVDTTNLAHTGNCQQTGIISRNDAFYCGKLIVPNAN